MKNPWPREGPIRNYPPPEKIVTHVWRVASVRRENFLNCQSNNNIDTATILAAKTGVQMSKPQHFCELCKQCSRTRFSRGNSSPGKKGSNKAVPSDTLKFFRADWLETTDLVYTVISLWHLHLICSYLWSYSSAYHSTSFCIYRYYKYLLLFI